MQRLDAPSRGHCLNCGSHVSPDFERTYGDSENRAHRCYNCDSRGRVAEGSAAGLEVDGVDPLENPERFGEGYEEIDQHVRATIDRSLGGGA